nr:Sapep family Mn(2+)-dependent dipeptidase [Maliibacterium massiliense]
MLESLDQYIAQHRQQLVDLTCALCRIPSYKQAPAGPNAPYGAGPRQALDYVLAVCAQNGWRTFDAQGHAGHAQIGAGKECVAVLTHLDVVPAGDGWDTDPFGAVVRYGRIYGRGTGDDKGPAAAAIMALQALQATGLPFKRRVRLIFGCDEESGEGDLAHYFQQADMPDMGFTPDAGYPVYTSEKHIFHAVWHKDVDLAEGNVLGIEAGERFNVVPSLARAWFAAPITPAQRQLAEAYARLHHLSVAIEARAITVHGVQAHASRPQGGVNAAQHLLCLLAGAKLARGAAGEAIAYLASVLQTETDGKSMNMACSDEVSGALTCNVGRVSLDERGLEVWLDMRCPVQVARDDLIVRCRSAAHEGGFTLNVQNFAEGIYVDKDSELVRTLLEVYEQQTGQKGEALSTGGGTYARQMPNRAVAFGAAFPGEEDLAHQSNEYITIDNLVKNARIIAHALARLAL